MGFDVEVGEEVAEGGDVLGGVGVGGFAGGDEGVEVGDDFAADGVDLLEVLAGDLRDFLVGVVLVVTLIGSDPGPIGVPSSVPFPRNAMGEEVVFEESDVGCRDVGE